ncbi:hypothetical protein [Aliihoeflea sp. 2WW]|uniref:hypothetical protein n=1 Tax=Aliihoeflea sp. 2WW TaxID=1381123 RepID=UPI0004B1F710|nr:hypothetical protein [Aliihoeflea sp. 2WW]
MVDQTQQHLADWLSENSEERTTWVAAKKLWENNYFSRSGALLVGERWSERASLPYRRRFAHTLLRSGYYPQAVELENSVLKDIDPSHENADKERRRAKNHMGIAQLYIDGSDYLKRVPPPKIDEQKGFCIAFNVAHDILSGVSLPIGLALRQRGYHFGAAAFATWEAPAGVPEFDAVCSMLANDGSGLVNDPFTGFYHVWHVDWSAGTVECEGINYFPYFHERVSQKARRYSANILDDPESSKLFQMLLLRADRALKFCKMLIPLASKGLPIRILCMDSHFAPWGIPREWCNVVGRDFDIHVVALSAGYENYYSNLSTREAATLAVEDLTAHPDVRTPLLGGAERFKQFTSNFPDVLDFADEEVFSWITQNRSKTVPSDFSEIKDRILSVRSRGGKVFVAFGKVSIDFAAPGDGGLAHGDFVEWINHLIDGISKTDNLLLIKPHPHELREEIVMGGVQLLRDLVPADLPGNAVFLPHDGLNTHELAEIVDAAFLWNGTASVEFPVLGVPVFQASVWGPRDYPVGLDILETREAYERVLSGQSSVGVSEETRRKAAAFLRFMKSEYVSMPYRYVRRAAINDYIGPPRFYEEDLDDLLTEGDPIMDEIISRIFP